MNKKLVFACACLGFLPATSVAVPTVYSYTGTPYTFIQDDPVVAGSYTTAMSLSGSITLAEAIAPSSSFASSSTPAAVLSFSFFDGRFELNTGNAAFMNFTLTTNAIGGIQDWNLSMGRSTPAADISQLEVGSTPCFTGGGGCDSALTYNPVFGPQRDRADSSVSGSWTVTAVPEPETYALFLAGLALVGFVAHRRSKLPR